MIYRIEVEIVTPVHPTEDPAVVEEAITNIFPSATVESGHGELIGTAHSIDRFAELIARQRIGETARTRLLDAIDGHTLDFPLKKQAAVAGVVNFALEEPDELGDLSVRIRVEQPSPRAFVEAIAGDPADDE